MTRKWMLGLLAVFLLFLLYLVIGYGVSGYVIVLLLASVFLSYSIIRSYLRQVRRDEPKIDVYRSLEHRPIKRGQ